MKYIKKVSVSPIPATSGAVIDSFNATNKTTNAPSIRAVEERLNGIVLYNNNNGLNENIILNDNVANYSKLKIEYKTSNNIYNSVEITDPNFKRVQLMADCENLETHIVLANAHIYIDGTLLNWVKHNFTVLSTDVVEVQTDISYYNLKITKVVGYK